MNRTRSKRAGTIALTGATAATLTLADVGSAEADQRCYNVHGSIEATVTTDGCTSPVGLCTAGTVKGAGPLNGATAFQTFALAPSAGMPGIEPPGEFSYSGELVLSTRNGDLFVRDLGIFSPGNEKFTELARVQGGTGRFSGAAGTFFISGDLTGGGTGFSSTMHGEFCVP